MSKKVLIPVDDLAMEKIRGHDISGIEIAKKYGIRLKLSHDQRDAVIRRAYALGTKLVSSWPPVGTRPPGWKR